MTPMQQVLTRALGTLATEQARPTPLPVLEGEVPRELRGVLLRNGPGRHERGGVRYGHPFDGDGFVQRLAFEEGRATWSGRWIRTREWVAEEAADRVLYRGFGTQRPGGPCANLGRLHFKNAANTSVVCHAGRTLALWEGGLPHALDDDLRTLGRYDFEGALRNPFGWLDRRLAPELPFSAHPKHDPETGELWSFGTAFGRRNRLLVYRVTPDGHLHRRVIELDGLPFVHDFALTPRWAVFVLPAARFDVARTLLGLRTPVDSLRLDDAPGTALLVPRDGGAPVRIEVPPGFVFHWAHAYEAPDGTVVLDGVRYDRFPELGPEGALSARGRPVRYRLDPSRGAVTQTPLSDIVMELPTCAAPFGAPHEAFWGTAAPPDRREPFLSGVARLEVATGTITYRELRPHYPGEPLPVGLGLLCVPVFEAEGASEIWLVRAESLETVARLALPAPVPPPLHGTWLGDR